MRIVAILNQKGGVGKTTTSVNLGAALARSGHRVLLVDCDSQANLTDHLGVDTETLGSSLYDVLTDGAAVSESVAPTSTPGLCVLPADEDLAAAEQELAGEMAREFRLQRALNAVDPASYDWVFIDCPPSLGLLSLNAMAAADELLITVQTEYFAMRGLSQIDQVISMVRDHVNPKLQILGILPTLVSPVTRLAREVIQEIEGHFGPLMFQTRIRQNIRLAEAPGHQVHIFDYDPTSAGATDYAKLAEEIEARIAARNAPAPDDGPGENGSGEGGQADTQDQGAPASEAASPDAVAPTETPEPSAEDEAAGSEPDATPLEPVAPEPAAQDPAPQDSMPKDPMPQDPVAQDPIPRDPSA